MNLFNTKTPIEPTNPQVFGYIKQQQYNQELTHADNKSYIPITTCLFEAIVSDYSSALLPRDIIFLLQIFNLYSAALNKKQKTIIYSSEKLAKLLGYKAKDKNNMRSIVLRRVKKLEQLGLLNVTRHKDKKGSDKVNEIVPILPDPLYDKIKYAPSNFNVDSTRLKGESNIQHILRTKLFVPINLEFIKSLFDDDRMQATHKLFYLNCIVTSYKNNQTTGKLSFATTSQELMSSNNISRATLFNILHFIKNQYPDYFIEVNHSYSKSDDIDSNRYDKSIFSISINPIVIPQSFLNKNNLAIQKEIDQTKKVEKKVEYGSIDNVDLVADNETAKPDTYQLSKTGVQIWKPGSLNLEAHNNKDIIIKNKDIDYIDENHLNFKNSSVDNSQDELIELPTTTNTVTNHKEEFLEDKLCLSSSEFYNNSSFFDKEVSKKAPEQKHQQEKRTELGKTYPTPDKAEGIELRHFYPISEKDASMLNFKANREFDTNFTNQLLLKLYIKYPEKRFKNKFTFSDYMIKTLKNENHQAPQVNNPSFRFSCNIGKEEKNILEYAKYLSEIESSFDTSKEMQVRKKIAGRFSTEIAYKILTKVEFKLNPNNSFITALIPSYLDLSERQTEILSDQLEAVYGINRYYVQEVEAAEKLLTPEFKTENTNSIKKPISFSEPSNGKEASEENTVWHQIRKGLSEELGEMMDTVWFSKAVAKECRETNTLTLTMPTRFMSDWISNNYSHVIRRLSGSVGVQYVEYGV